MTVGDNDRAHVKSVLEVLGFRPEVIDEASHPTPDLLLPLSTGYALIEVKSKDDDHQLRRIVDSAPGTTHAYTNSSIGTALRRGMNQIRGFPEKSDYQFAIIWLLAGKSRITFLTRPAIRTLLYGVNIVEGFTSNPRKFYEKDCFFFGHSFFFRHKDLDAVVLEDHRETTLCINPLSDQYPVFALTDFVRVFKERASVIDPREKEAANECFLADYPCSRNDRNSVVKYLKDKYGLDEIRIIQFFLVNYPVNAGK